MKKIILILTSIIIVTASTFAQDIWKTSKGSTISFFSHAPLEDIFAESDEFSGAINTKTNVVAVFVKVNTLEFENKLQQEHYNEKYMESDKFPKASFKGNIEGVIDWSKPGVYNANAIGTLTIHGVEKERTAPTIITIDKNGIGSVITFKVKVEDHKIKVPSMVFQKVAEEVEIKINAKFEPYEKK